MIKLSHPTSSPELEASVIETLRSGWWGYGQKTKELEDRFAKLVGKKYAVAVSSGTSALDLCYRAYDLHDGECITTPMTFVSNAITAQWNGLEVAFCDIDPETLCLSPETLGITKDTKALCVVDSHGRLADIQAMREKFDGLIIEDCAHALLTPGVGKHSDIQIYSFQAVKTIPAGDGGMITTDDEKIYERLKSLTWLNVKKTVDRCTSGKYSWDYDIDAADGIKAYMNDLTATIVLAQIDRLDEILAKRQAIQARYNEALKDVPQIQIPAFSHTCQYYTMKCEDRNGLSDYLSEFDIHTSVHFKPLNVMTYWRKAAKYMLLNTMDVWPRLLSLPVHDALLPMEQDFVIERVKEFYA